MFCDVVINTIFSSLLGFTNVLQKLTHTHRDTAAAKPKTFVFEQRMLPSGLSHRMNIPMGYLVRHFRFCADFLNKSRIFYKKLIELLNLVPKQTVHVLNLVLLA